MSPKAGKVCTLRKNARRITSVSYTHLLWGARCARTIFLPDEANVGRIAAGLLAGIVLVDWLAVAPQLPHWLSGVVFLPLFGATLLLQRFVPEA